MSRMELICRHYGAVKIPPEKFKQYFKLKEKLKKAEIDFDLFLRDLLNEKVEHIKRR